VRVRVSPFAPLFLSSFPVELRGITMSMQVSVETTSELGRRVTIQIPDAGVSRKFDQKINELSKKMNLKGFRPGKVPVAAILKKFGPQVRAEVIEDLIKDHFPKALSGENIHPAGVPTIEKIQDENDRLEFVASLEIMPNIQLADLSAVEFEKRVAQVTDADVSNMLEKMKLQYCEWTKVDRAAKKGDKLLVDISRQLLDGKHPEAFEQKNVNLILKTEGMIPGLVEGLVGKSAGDKVELKLAYPEDWKDDHDAGLEVEIKLEIHQVLEQEAMTDEALANKMRIEVKEGEDLIANLKAKVTERLTNELQETLTDEVKEKVLEILIEQNKFTLPGIMVDQEKVNVLKEFEQRLKNNEHVHLPEEAELQDMAEKRVMLGLLINKIVEVNQITVTQEKVRAEAEKLAKNFGASADQFLQYYLSNQNLRAGLERKALLDETVSCLLKQLKVKETPVSFDAVMS
jgi:trigger factor